jgi:hypothetical protein
MIASSPSNINLRSIGNAKIAGMDVDLALTSNQYSIALVVFFGKSLNPTWRHHG